MWVVMFFNRHFCKSPYPILLLLLENSVVIKKEPSDDTPRISGLLNNCSMYCCLPILLQNINKLAELEKIGHLPDERDPIYQSYSTLKNLFFSWYRVNDVAVTSWERLNNFLLIHSFYANEIIFSPVFRQYIAQEASRHPTATWHLPSLCDIQPERFILGGVDLGSNPAAGRYNSLPITEIDELFFKKFGISVTLFEYDDASGGYVQRHEGKHVESEWQEPVRSIKMYLKDGHYELQPHENRGGVCTDQFTNEINQLNPALYKVHDEFTMSQSDWQSQLGLDRLKRYVCQIWRNDSTQHLYHSNDYPYITAHQYATNHNECNHADRMTFAVILLTLAFDEKNQRLPAKLLKALNKKTPYTPYLIELIIKIVKTGNLELLKVRDPGIRLLHSARNNGEGLTDDLMSEIPHVELLKKLSDNLCFNILLQTIESYPVSRRNLTNRRPSNFMPTPDLVNPYFQLKFIIALAAVGAALLFLAFILILPPLGVAGVIASKVAAGFGGASLLASSGLFAYQKGCFSGCYAADPTVPTVSF